MTCTSGFPGQFRKLWADKDESTHHIPVMFQRDKPTYLAHELQKYTYFLNITKKNHSSGYDNKTSLE